MTPPPDRQFIALTSIAVLKETDLATFDVGDERIAVAKVTDGFAAFADTCTHRECSLSEGDLDGHVVTCPCHGSEFDITTGIPIGGPAREPIVTYPVRIEGGNLLIEL